MVVVLVKMVQMAPALHSVLIFLAQVAAVDMDIQLVIMVGLA